MNDFWPIGNFVLLAAVILLLTNRRVANGRITTPVNVERIVGALIIIGLSLALFFTNTQ